MRKFSDFIQIREEDKKNRGPLNLGVVAEEILDNHARVRFTVIVDDKYHTTGLHHDTVAKPTYAPDFSSPIEDRFIDEALKIPVISHLQTPTLERVLL